LAHEAGAGRHHPANERHPPGLRPGDGGGAPGVGHPGSGLRGGGCDHQPPQHAFPGHGPPAGLPDRGWGGDGGAAGDADLRAVDRRDPGGGGVSAGGGAGAGGDVGGRAEADSAPLRWCCCGWWNQSIGGRGAISMPVPSLTMPQPPTATGPPPGSSDPPPRPPDSLQPQLPWSGLDRPGLLQALGGLILGLIALFSSYDHLSFAGRSFPLPQQWGIPCIAASVATAVVDAELASRSRLREAQDAARAADETAQERDRAEQRENEADRERNRAAEARERQRESLERLDQAALLSARVQLDPSALNRERLRTFLALRGQGALGEEL